MNRLRVWGLSTLLSFALASLVLQSPALAQSSSWQMQQMRQQQQMQQQQAMQRQQQMQQQQAMQRQQQQMQQQQAMQRQQQMQQQQAMQRQQQIQQQQASQRQQQQYQQRQQQQTMQSQRQQQQALIQRQQQSAGSLRQNFQQRLGVQQQNQQRTYAPAQASAAIKGAANRNVTAREGRGFVSSGGVAKLTRPMTPGDIKKGFTGRVTADGRALVKFQGRVFAVPAAGISGLVKKPSAQSQMVANTNRWNAQQKVAMNARLKALTAQNVVVANNRLNTQQSIATNARLRALSAQRVAAAETGGGNNASKSTTGVQFPASGKNRNGGTRGVTTTGYTYNSIENPGPLARIEGNPASNFTSGKYNTIVLKEDLVLYRAGDSKNALGQWYTREPPQSRAQARIDSAVKSQWVDQKTGSYEASSPINTVHEIRIPKGTTIYEGPTGYQEGVHIGGEDKIQIFVEAPWKIGAEVVNSRPLR